MSKISVVVTPKINVKLDDEGNILFDENQIPVMIDPTNLGLYLRSHTIQVNQIDPQTNTLQTGIIFRVEVFWDKIRTPSPSFEDPSDIVWVSFKEETDETEDYDDDAETDEDEEDSQYLDQ